MPSHRQLVHPCRRGFTLIEFMVTLAVAAILLGLAVPSFRTFIQNSRLQAPATDLLHAIQLARTEAIKRQQNVVVCASTDSSSANASCSGGDFTSGWIVFADDGPAPDWQRQPSETLISTHSNVDSGVNIKSDNDHIVAYASNGFPASPGASGKTPTANISICDSRGNVASAGTQSVARAILVDPRIGRAVESNLIADVANAGGC